MTERRSLFSGRPTILEGEDRVDTHGEQAVVATVSTGAFVDPIPSQLRSNRYVGVRQPVETEGRSAVRLGTVTNSARSSRSRFVAEDFVTSTELPAVVDGVEQVLIDSVPFVSSQSTDFGVGTVIALHHVFQIVRHGDSGNEAVHVDVALTDAEASSGRHVGQCDIV